MSDRGRVIYRPPTNERHRCDPELGTMDEEVVLKGLIWQCGCGKRWVSTFEHLPEMQYEREPWKSA